MPDYKEVGETQDTRVENLPAEDKLGSPEHVNAALKKADEGTDPSKSPKLLAGKFKSREELVKAVANAADKVYADDEVLEAFYKQIEKRIGQPTGERTVKENPPDKSESVPSESGKPSSEPSKDAAGETSDETADINFDALGAEFGRDGKLSDDSYKALEASGFDRATVDVYLEGIRATTAKMYNRVGGEAKYKAMLEWGASNLAQEEVAAFDKAIGSAAETERNLAIDGMWKRYTDANGNPPSKRVTPEGSEIISTGAGFRSSREFIEALKDPRYGKDPAYEREILARLRVSRV